MKRRILAVLAAVAVLTGTVIGTSVATQASYSRQAAWHVTFREPISIDTRNFGPSAPGQIRHWTIQDSFFPNGVTSITLMVTSIPNGTSAGHWRVANRIDELPGAAGLANLGIRPVITTYEINVFTTSKGVVDIYYAPYFVARNSHVKIDVIAADGWGT
jgi:hypothetical protein